jgi:putative ABC transport system permease protein
MRRPFPEAGELLRIATEALGRYRLRTALSVLGVVLGVAAVIAMTSVSEGAAREALAQVDALGLDNLVVRNTGAQPAPGGARRGRVARDVERVSTLVPQVRTASPLVARFLRVRHRERTTLAQVLGVLPAYGDILRLSTSRGRFLVATDETEAAAVCVIGAGLGRQLFGFRDPVGESLRLGDEYCQLVGVLNEQGSGARTSSSLAWHDLNQSVFMPFSRMTRRPLALEPGQPIDEIWLQVEEGERANELGQILSRVLSRTHASTDVAVVVPRELLAQRYRTQRTFTVVVGSVGVLALLVGGIGIMNIMLASVIERTHEIGIRRTVGATRRDVGLQFLTEALMMTVAGGLAGIVIGVVVSGLITTYAGWSTHVSAVAVVGGFAVSAVVGILFGLYPALKAAELQPIDAVRYE